MTCVRGEKERRGGAGNEENRGRGGKGRGAAAIKGKGRRQRQRRENFQYGEVNFTSADSRLRENTRGRKKTHHRRYF